MKDIKRDASRDVLRLMMYQFLALALYEPSKSLLEAFEQNHGSQHLLEASEKFIGSQGRQLMQELLDTLGEVKSDHQKTLLDLKVEYNRLFVGPMPPVCPPYESVFDKKRSTEDQGTVMGPTSEAMAGALREEGLKLTLDYAELPDHMAIELEFMYYLLARADARGEDSEIYQQKADIFLKDHLVNWLPEFGANVAKKSNHPFYQSVGRLLEATITADADF